VQPALKSLLGQLAVLPVSSKCSPRRAVAEFDYQCPLLSLPLAARPRLQHPGRIVYLQATPPDSTLEGALGHDARRVEGRWRGAVPEHSDDRNRSLPLAALASLRNVRHSMSACKKSCATRQPKRHGLLGTMSRILASNCRILPIRQRCFLHGSGDYGRYRDRHLGAALGKPVWVLLPYARIGVVDERDDSLVPSMRLFSRPQSRLDGVIERVRQHLRLR